MWCGFFSGRPRIFGPLRLQDVLLQERKVPTSTNRGQSTHSINWQSTHTANLCGLQAILLPRCCPPSTSSVLSCPATCCSPPSFLLRHLFKRHQRNQLSLCQYQIQIPSHGKAIATLNTTCDWHILGVHNIICFHSDSGATRRPLGYLFEYSLVTVWRTCCGNLL